MIRRSVVALLLALAAGASVPAHAAIRYRHVSIRAAAQLCQRERGNRQYRIAVIGFFRPGPENHGPDILGGALFDSDTVPRDAALHIAKDGGIPFGVSVAWKFAGSIDGITRPHARVSVRGVLYCVPGSTPFLKPDAITVSKPLASPPFVTPGPTRLDVTERSFDGIEGHVTVSSRGLVNQVVTDLNALPLYPRHGPISCPADFGSWYVLSFRYRAGSEETVTVDPGGCEAVTRQGQRARWMLTLEHPAILAVLERIVVESETADSARTSAHILTVKQLRALTMLWTAGSAISAHRSVQSRCRPTSTPGHARSPARPVGHQGRGFQ